MIPKINDRGQSFKGLVNYLMHDKGRADTSERVAWAETGNMFTQDPFKAAKIMAFTDINADMLKENVTGANQSAGAVFHYSLGWEEGVAPDREHMRDCVLETLECLGMAEHEFIIVAHDDTKHAHVHVVVNLTHPKTGLRLDPGLSIVL